MSLLLKYLEMSSNFQYNPNNPLEEIGRAVADNLKKSFYTPLALPAEYWH